MKHPSCREGFQGPNADPAVEVRPPEDAGAAYLAIMQLAYQVPESGRRLSGVAREKKSVLGAC